MQFLPSPIANSETVSTNLKAMGEIANLIWTNVLKKEDEDD